MVESVQRLKSIEHVFQMMDSRVDISTFVQANNPGKYTPPVKSFTQVKRKAGFGWGPVIIGGIPPFPPRVQPGIQGRIPPPARDPRWDPASHLGSKVESCLPLGIQVWN